jgi:hypothetical protein
MRINLYAYPVLVVAIFLGVIFAAQLTPYWQTTGEVDETTGLPAEVTTGNPDEIKGWMTLGDISRGYAIAAELKAAFAIPADTPESTALKDLEKIATDFSVSDLRTWLKERLATK